MKFSNTLWTSLPLVLILGCHSAPPTEAPLANGPPGPLPSGPAVSTTVDAPPPAPFSSDKIVADAIRQKLDSDPHLAAASKNLSYSVNRGLVTLRGTVPSQDLKNAIIDSLAKLPGVDRVNPSELGIER